MTWELGWSVAGLAALDSLNPATLVAITLILLGSRRRPLAEALAFVAGAFATVLLVGVALYAGADAAAQSIAGALTWLRRGAFGLAALVLLVSAVRSLRERWRSAIALPTWFTPATAAGLGVVMTGADLPNAFPYFIAIERMLASGVTLPTAVVVLVLYAVVYCLPCLALLGIGLRRGDRIVAELRRLHGRFGAGATVTASPLRAAGFLLGAVALAAIAATI
jgi:cytochrome c biogenesis protein CcdA